MGTSRWLNVADAFNCPLNGINPFVQKYDARRSKLHAQIYAKEGKKRREVYERRFENRDEYKNYSVRCKKLLEDDAIAEKDGFHGIQGQRDGQFH